MNVLVIGRGSIGNKHLKTLKTLEKKFALAVEVFEPSSHGPNYFKELRAVLLEKKINVVFICNPTSLHAKTALVCLEAGAHIFLEKPLAVSFSAPLFAQMKKLIQKKRLTFMIGYDMRFNPFIEKAHEFVEAGAIGDVWGARVMAGQYLPEWRPGSDYTKSYSAKKALGGGVMLDLSHEVDYLTWLLPKKISYIESTKLRTGRLPIETEDLVGITLVYKDKSQAHIHLDYLNVPYRRSLELYGNKGTLLWDDNTKEIRLYTRKSGAWRSISFKKEEYSETKIFTKELTHFFESIRNKTKPRNSFENAVEVMRILEAASTAARTKKAITI